MKATVQQPERSILASEPVPGGFNAPLDRAPMSVGRRLRPTRALVAAILAIVVSAAGLVWATRGESGIQLLETESASSARPTPPEEPVAPAARSGAERGALVVDVRTGDTDGGPSGGGNGESTTTAEQAADAISPDAITGSVIDTDSDTPKSSPTSSTEAPAPEGAALRTERSSPTTGPSSHPGVTSAAARPTTASTTGPTASTSTPSGVAWEEHFDTLDSGRWQIEHSTYGDGNGERQCYRPDNVRVAGGRLVLTAKAETATCPNGSTRSVTSGMIRSRGLTFSPGQAIEFRVKLTPPDPSNQAGLWPAVWASGWAGSWPRGGELDFLEVMTAEDPRRAVFSLHYADPSGGHELQNKAVPLAGYFSDGWHTIRFDYGRNGNLVWFLDGTKVFSVSAAATAQGYPAPFDQTIDEIKVNLAVGGTPGPLAAGALGVGGATFEIDYIKVFDL